MGKSKSKANSTNPPNVITTRRGQVKFPEGFQVFDRAARERSKAVISKPLCTVTKSGFLSFNTRAARFLLGLGHEKNVAAFLAYNSKDRALAIRPVPYHLKPPETYKLVVHGGYKNTVQIGFVTASRGWNIPLDNARHPCMWDEKNGILLVSLSIRA